MKLIRCFQVYISAMNYPPNIVDFKNSSAGFYRSICMVFACGWLSACTPVTSVSPEHTQINIARTQSLANTFPGRCSFEQHSNSSDQSGLNAAAIDLLNWNIKKGSEENWSTELAHLSHEKDLVLIQEAVQSMKVELQNGQSGFKSFAPGYQTADITTGVATFSAIAPINECQLTSYEPWLRTPKATSITQYAIEGRDETLIVVNIHMVNFTLGQKHFRRQLNAATALLNNHQGPVIISGDFNTWRPMRHKIIREEMMKLGLEPVRFPVDSRTRFLGQAVDHIYIKNLAVTEAMAHESDSSDHNPMTIRLEVEI